MVNVEWFLDEELTVFLFIWGGGWFGAIFMDFQDLCSARAVLWLGDGWKLKKIAHYLA